MFKRFVKEVVAFMLAGVAGYVLVVWAFETFDLASTIYIR